MKEKFFIYFFVIVEIVMSIVLVVTFNVYLFTLPDTAYFWHNPVYNAILMNIVPFGAIAIIAPYLLDIINDMK